MSFADHSGNLSLCIKSDRERENDSDYQGQFGKNSIKFPMDGANTISNAGTFVTISAAKNKVGSWYIVYVSNRPHFLRVYQRDNPRGMLGEHEKSL